jgi:hypothetical protein
MDMQAAAALSSSEWIQSEGKVADKILPNDLYAPEPSHKWCYYFELADLARQQQKWEEVASLGDVAYNSNDYPNDPSEHFPLSKGIHRELGRAYELTEQSKYSMMNPLLCRLWQRIEESTLDSAEKDTTITSIHSLLDCSP